jgi:hypothetical protein
VQDHAKLSAEWKKVWNTLPPDERARLEPKIRDSHNALLSIRTGGWPRSLPVRELAHVHSLLHDDPDRLLIDSTSADASQATVGPDGEVYFGGVDYDSTDPGWAYCPLAWYWTDGQTPSFNNTPATVEIADTVTIALLGDWGGNNASAQEVAGNAQSRIGAGDVIVHLGDVYYAGTNESGVVESDYETENFVTAWPSTQATSFALNSNHDMYAHGTGYYLTALASPVFAAQTGCSYFALYNSAFRIVGLDTAYFDPDQSSTGFMDGSLGPTGPGTQAQFLNEQAQAAAAAKQQLILLTHHNGLLYDGSATVPLWDQVVAELAPLSGDTVIWYWGHEHMGVVYTDRQASGITIRPRCCGHGCIPWGVATGLNASGVDWYEHTVLGPANNYFVANGFATLALADSSISETFYRQDGAQSWGN